LYEQLQDRDSRADNVPGGVYEAHPVYRKPAVVPRLGPLTATALQATVGRHFPATSTAQDN